jgi:pimeloyl-ACP methyl ester carboxylesterase
MLWWGILADVPTGLGRIDCPVILAQGTADLVAVGQTPRYLAAITGARFVPLVGAGHAPQSDTPPPSSRSSAPPPPRWPPTASGDFAGRPRCRSPREGASPGASCDDPL